MKTNNDSALVSHESKKRKIDEDISGDCENSNIAMIIKQEQDECMEIIQVDQPKEETAKEVIDVGTESDEDNTGQCLTSSGGIRIIPISQFEKINNEQETVRAPDQVTEETQGWNCLAEKIVLLEEKLSQKITLEMSALKQSWETNNCKCKYVHEQAMATLRTKIDQLQQESEQKEKQKRLLMNEKNELQVVLDKERDFKVQISGMFSLDVRKPNKDLIVKSEIKNNNNIQYDDGKMSHNLLEIKKEEPESSQTHETPESEVKKKWKPENRKGTLRISRSIRDAMPRRLSRQSLADEMHERYIRRYNVIMRGMRYSGANLHDEVKNLLWQRTRIIPNIVNYMVMQSYLVLQMASLSDKYTLLSRKRALRSDDITIHNDITTREEEIQEWLLRVARDQENMRKRVEIRFLKIKVDGDWWIWDERSGDLLNRGRRASLYD